MSGTGDAMGRLRRLLPLIPLAGVLALWAASYFWVPIVFAGGYAAAADRGTIQCGGPDVVSQEPFKVRLDRVEPELPRTEVTHGYRYEPWKPVRRLAMMGGHLWFVEGWLVAVAAAAATAWTMRRQRRAESPHGFEVLSADGGRL
jgi:hypothetical protein